MNELFTFHKLNNSGMEKSKKIAYLYNKLLTELSRDCQDSREFSICKTKLEESCFYAKKAMASCHINQEPIQNQQNVHLEALSKEKRDITQENIKVAENGSQGENEG